MYILGYLHTPHRENKRKHLSATTFMESVDGGTLSKTNSRLAKQHDDLLLTLK